MLQLIESHPAAGGLSLLYTRRPDAYQSYQAECRAAEIVVCVNDASQVLGQAVCLPRQFYVEGAIQTVGYVTGLHKADGAIVDVLGMMEAGRIRSASDQMYCSFLDDNSQIYEMFAKRRLTQLICNYSTLLFSPKALRPVAHNWQCRQAGSADTEALQMFLNTEAARFSYYPVFTNWTDFTGLKVTDFYILEDSSGILAAGALWDQRLYRQYVMVGYSGIYRLAASNNWLLRALRYPTLAKVGETANFAYLSFLLSRDNDIELQRVMLSELSARAHHFDSLTIGAVTDSDLAELLTKMKSFTLQSRICLIDSSRSAKALAIQKPLRIECSLL
jgi:hypothetical protein